MLTAGETHVVRMLAVDQSGRILPPCPRVAIFNQLEHPFDAVGAEVQLPKSRAIDRRAHGT
jgi:hypothetical protein